VTTKGISQKDKIPQKRRIFYLSIAVLACLIVGLLILLYHPEQKKSTPPEGLLPEAAEFNVLLITIDTLRADRLGCYGYQKIETPRIDNFAQEGVLLENNIADVPLTLPSHASILTGTYVLYHNVRDNGNYILRKEYLTIAEILKECGYATSAFVSAFVVDSRFGLDQGFDYYYDFDEEILDEEKALALSEIQRIGEETNREFFDWLSKNYRNRFFTWLHLYDPHDPYTPPEPYRTRYSHSLYDGEVAYIDMLMGEIISRLKAFGILDDTLIIFASDHGEALGEHNEETHQYFIYDSVMHVPLIFRLPGTLPQGKVIKEQTRNIDIVPTILSLLNIDLKKYPELQGVDLLPLLKGEVSNLQLEAYSETKIPQFRFGWSDLASIRYEGWKYIRAPRPELYDVAADPGELNNLIEQHQDKADEFQKRLELLVKNYSAEASDEVKPQRLDAESAAKLQSLGYLTGTTSKQSALSNIDPKDKIEEFKFVNYTMSSAIKDVEEGRFRQALTELRELEKVNPNFDQMRYYLGKAYLGLNQPRKAIEQFKSALRINPNHLLAYVDSAKAYVALKEFDTAETILRSGFGPNQDSYLFHFNLGFINQLKGDTHKAIKEYLKAEKFNSKSSQLCGNISSAYLILGEKDEAIQWLKKALSLNPNLPQANTNLGMLLVEKGEYEEAYGYFKKAVELIPDDFRHQYNLALICQKLGKKEEASAALREARRLRPDFNEADLSFQEPQPEASYQKTYTLRHIIVENREQADMVMEALKNGEDFVRLASLHSIDPNARGGGNLTYIIKPEDLLTPVAQAVSSLKPGQISPPIKTPRGYYIVQRIN